METEVTANIPKADAKLAGAVAEVMHGGLGKVHRIVARHQLKDRIKILEQVIRVHEPLVKAMKITQTAFQQGVMEGIRQVAAAEREKEEAATKALDATTPATPAVDLVHTEPSNEESKPTADKTE